MFLYCIMVLLFCLASKAHEFPRNSSIKIYHIVDDLNTYIKNDLREQASWPSGNHNLGFAHRFAIHHRRCSDFSTIAVLEEPLINITYNRHKGSMVYNCHVVLALKALYFDFILDVSVAGQKWDSSDVRIHVKENAWDVSFEVHVRDDGFCRIQYLKSEILYLGDFDIVIRPPDHTIRLWLIWIIHRFMVLYWFSTWDKMLRETVKEEFNTPGLNEIICKGFGYKHL